MSHAFFIMLAYTSSLLSAGITISSKLLASDIPPLLLTLLRFTISTLCLIPWVNWREAKKLNLYLVSVLTLLGFVGIFFANYLYLTGIAQTTAINASIITALVPVIVLLLYSIIRARWPERKHIAGFLLSLAGVIIIVTNGNFAAVSSFSWGDLYILGSALCWATFGIIVKRLSQYLSTFFITFAANAISLGFAIPTLDINAAYAIIPQLTLFQWLLISYIGILGTAFNYFIYSEAMRYLGPPTAAFIIYGNIPVFVALLSYILLGEQLLINHIIGIGLVIGALYITRAQVSSATEAIQQ